MFSEDANVKKQIVTLLNDVGIDIEDYRFDSDEKQLYLKRTIAGKPYELSLSEESDGTRKLIAALPAILICAKGTSQADMFTYQFGAAREPELSREA